MIQLLIPFDVQTQLRRELRKAGRREIGGLLFGEHVGEDLFKIVGISVQTKLGTHSHFTRDPAQHASQLDAFFQKHQEACSRFNYLGEWHSHPSFDVLPSGQDLLSMSKLVEDSTVGVKFAVLLIVRLQGAAGISLSATLCQPEERFTPGQVYLEVQGHVQPREPNSRLVRPRRWPA